MIIMIDFEKDSLKDILMKMTLGNPGSVYCLMELVTRTSDIDKSKNKFQDIRNMEYLKELVDLNIVGTDIDALYKDICGKDLPSVIAVLKAVQLGLISKEVIQDACSRRDNTGVRMLDAETYYYRIKAVDSFFDGDNISKFAQVADVKTFR